MTAHEVEWFINHKYGEQAYIVETEKQIIIFTAKSKWIVQKTDYKRFRFYTLFHSNNTQGYGYHVQMRGNHIDYLVYCAIMHDNGLVQDWNYFLNSWQLYCLGRQIEERAALFEWFSAISGCSSAW